MAGHAQWPVIWGGMPPFADDPRRACRNQNPDLFFAEGEGAKRNTALAKTICRRCPIRDECAAWSIPQASVRGVWGGLTEPERERARNGPPEAVTGPPRPKQPSAATVRTTQTLAVIAHQIAEGLTVDEIVALSPHNRKTVLRHLHKVRDTTGLAPPGFPKSPGVAA